MIFSSLTFLFGYFPIVLLVYYISPLRYRNLWLLIVSLIFYGWGEPLYIGIMILSIVVNYYYGYKVSQYLDNKTIAKKYLIRSIVISLGLLAFFKYYDFFIISFNQVTGLSFLQPLKLGLPIGISFYTFQALSYTIDVYRKDAEAQPSIINFGTYVALFPQLIAGPIVRYKTIAQQLQSRKENVDQFYEGIKRFCVGLMKKVLLANNIGPLWETISQYQGSSLTVLGAWLGIIAFSFQIYFDFSGYSDMAIGLGKMFGFDFLENFNYPYISKSITDFWRRWHISLGTWFKEYVYIPLGGNRNGLWKTYRNIFIVWFLTGFWHGANWNFMLWGMYFGIILMLEKTWILKILDKMPSFVQHLYALVLIVLGWVLFAFEDMGQAWLYMKTMFGSGGLLDANTLYLLRNYIVVLVVCLLASTPLISSFYKKYKEQYKLEYCVPFLVMILLFLTTAYLVDATYNPFLYFRF